MRAIRPGNHESDSTGRPGWWPRSVSDVGAGGAKAFCSEPAYRNRRELEGAVRGLLNQLERVEVIETIALLVGTNRFVSRYDFLPRDRGLPRDPQKNLQRIAALGQRP